MNYHLVFSEIPDGTTDKDVGKNIFFKDLPRDYRVYLICYGGPKLKEELRNGLISLGEDTGKNLHVNISKRNDPNYDEIARRFNIVKYPTIVITALSEIASPPEEYSTAYIRIDQKKLLNSPDLAIECIDRIFNLFIRGKISEAMAAQRSEMREFRIKTFLKDAFKGLKDLVPEKGTVSVGFLGAKIELKKG